MLAVVHDADRSNDQDGDLAGRSLLDEIVRDATMTTRHSKSDSVMSNVSQMKDGHRRLLLMRHAKSSHPPGFSPTR